MSDELCAFLLGGSEPPAILFPSDELSLLLICCGLHRRIASWCYKKWPAAEGDVTDGVNILFNTPPEYAVQAQTPDFLCVLHYLTVAEKKQEEGGEQGAQREQNTVLKRQEGRIACCYIW